VGGDPQEGLAYRDEGRDVEDPLLRQVMKRKAIEEQKPPHEGVQGKAKPQPVEVGEGDDLLVTGRQCQRPDGVGRGRQPTTRAFSRASLSSSILWISTSVTPEGSHSAMGEGKQKHATMSGHVKAGEG
jgi:hypothetical protein